MKNRQNITLRGSHSLIYSGGDLWEFVSHDNMPIYLTYGNTLTEEHCIIAIDADSMGMPLFVGSTIVDYKIKSMFEQDGKYYVAMKPIAKEKIEDLEKNDTIYVAKLNETFDFGKYEVVSVSLKIQNGNDWHEVVARSIDNPKCNETFYIDADTTDELDGKEGVKTLYPEYMFTNEKNAKNFIYDKIQDKIEVLRNYQRKIMI